MLPSPGTKRTRATEFYDGLCLYIQLSQCNFLLLINHVTRSFLVVVQRVDVQRHHIQIIFTLFSPKRVLGNIPLIEVSNKRSGFVLFNSPAEIDFKPPG